MKIAITDYSFPSLDIEESILRPLGHEIASLRERKSAAELTTLVADADAVITQFATIDARVIAGMQRAKVIVRYGIGVDNVDLEAARVRGIPVCNVPDYCIDEVADHTLAFILSTTRQVVPNTLHVRDGKWGLATPLAQCDIVTLHCPSTPQTKNLLNDASLGRMKQGSVVVNLGRGDLIDSGSLIAALQSGKIAAAALDVFEQEPLPPENPLRLMSNVITASHIASASPKSVRTLRETAAKIAIMAFRGEPLPNIVN